MGSVFSLVAVLVSSKEKQDNVCFVLKVFGIYKVVCRNFHLVRILHKLPPYTLIRG